MTRKQICGNWVRGKRCWVRGNGWWVRGQAEDLHAWFRVIRLILPACLSPTRIICGIITHSERQHPAYTVHTMYSSTWPTHPQSQHPAYTPWTTAPGLHTMDSSTRPTHHGLQHPAYTPSTPSTSLHPLNASTRPTHPKRQHPAFLPIILTSWNGPHTYFVVIQLEQLLTGWVYLSSCALRD